MGGDVELIPLGELVDSERGITYGIVQPGKHVTDGIPIVRVTDIRNGKISNSNPLRVDPGIATKYRRTTLKGGELLLTLVGTVGELAIVPPEMAGWNTARAVAVIPVLDDPGPLWVQYALQAGPARDYISSRLNTTVQATLNLRDVSSFPVPMPEKAVRDSITHILGSLDEKIELNRQINQTLEQMAQAIFKSWFIDFDPVVYNAVQAGNPVPERFQATAERYRQNPDSQTLPQHILDLFPDRFEDSEFGGIPVGWTIGPLSDVATLEAKSANPNKSPDTIWEHFSIPAYDAGFAPKLERGDTIKSSKYRVPKRAVLASKLNPQFPRIWLPNPSDPHNAICSTEFMPFTPHYDSWRPFVYELLKSSVIQDKILSHVSGSTGSRQRVKPKEISSMAIVTPPGDLIDKFSINAESMHTQMLQNLVCAECLAKTRNTLLPKLISGELRISNIENSYEVEPCLP